MTREDAIQRLKFLKGIYSVDTETALDMAIEALQREEAEEKGYCHRIKPNGGDTE